MTGENAAIDLHPLRQDGDAVVDAADEQQQRLDDEDHLIAALDPDQRQRGSHHADADDRQRADEHDHHGGADVGLRQVDAEEEAPAPVSTTTVWMKPQMTANIVAPKSCDARRTGAIIVYSSVPSQRSQLICSAMTENTTDR